MRADSQIAFLYFQDFERSCRFFTEFLELETVIEKQWCRVFQVARGSFVGAVDASQRWEEFAVEKKGHLVSFNLTDLAAVEQIRQKALAEGYDAGPLRRQPQGDPQAVEGLCSFFLKGPEGYSFEFECFTESPLRELFCAAAAQPGPGCRAGEPGGGE